MEKEVPKNHYVNNISDDGNRSHDYDDHYNGTTPADPNEIAHYPILY